MQQVAKNHALHEFHNNVWAANPVAVVVNALFFTGVVDSHNRRVSHPSRRLGFLTETRLKAGVVGQVAFEQLNCNDATESGVHTLVDVRHSAATN